MKYDDHAGENDGLLHDQSAVYNEFKDFTSLEAWKKANEVKLFFYRKILIKLPKEEKYNLALQIRTAAISITANIAEGYGRFHHKEAIQFYRISRASLYELKDHLLSCHDLGFIDKDNLHEGAELIESAKKLLNGYINYIKKK